MEREYRKGVFVVIVVYFRERLDRITLTRDRPPGKTFGWFWGGVLPRCLFSCGGYYACPSSGQVLDLRHLQPTKTREPFPP